MYLSRQTVRDLAEARRGGNVHKRSLAAKNPVRLLTRFIPASFDELSSQPGSGVGSGCLKTGSGRGAGYLREEEFTDIVFTSTLSSKMRFVSFAARFSLFALIAWLLVIYAANIRSDDSPRNLRDPVPLGFCGRIQGVDRGRGLHVNLRGERQWNNLSGTCNSTACLIDVVAIGDSLVTYPGSRVVRLVKAGKGSDWYIGWKEY